MSQVPVPRKCACCVFIQGSGREIELTLFSRVHLMASNTTRIPSASLARQAPGEHAQNPFASPRIIPVSPESHVYRLSSTVFNATLMNVTLKFVNTQEVYV